MTTDSVTTRLDDWYGSLRRTYRVRIEPQYNGWGVTLIRKSDNVSVGYGSGSSMTKALLQLSENVDAAAERAAGGGGE